MATSKRGAEPLTEVKTVLARPLNSLLRSPSMRRMRMFVRMPTPPEVQCTRQFHEIIGDLTIRVNARALQGIKFKKNEKGAIIVANDDKPNWPLPDLMVPDFWLVAIDGRNCLTPEFTDAALEFLNGPRLRTAYDLTFRQKDVILGKQSAVPGEVLVNAGWSRVEGFLEKQSIPAFGKPKWTKRYFVLDPGNKMLFRHRSKPVEGDWTDSFIDFEHIRIVSWLTEQDPAWPATEPRRFKLVMHDDSVRTLCAPNHSSARLWVTSIAHAIGQTYITRAPCEPGPGEDDQYRAIDEANQARPEHEQSDWDVPMNLPVRKTTLTDRGERGTGRFQRFPGDFTVIVDDSQLEGIAFVNSERRAVELDADEEGWPVPEIMIKNLWVAAVDDRDALADRHRARVVKFLNTEQSRKAYALTFRRAGVVTGSIDPVPASMTYEPDCISCAGRIEMLSSRTSAAETWVKRYMTVDAGNGISMWKSAANRESEPADLTLSPVDIAGVSHLVQQPDDMEADAPVVFQLKTVSGETLNLRAECAEACWCWMASIGQVGGFNKLTATSCEAKDPNNDEYAKIAAFLETHPAHAFDWVVDVDYNDRGTGRYKYMLGDVTVRVSLEQLEVMAIEEREDRAIHFATDDRWPLPGVLLPDMWLVAVDRRDALANRHRDRVQKFLTEERTRAAYALTFRLAAVGSGITPPQPEQIEISPDMKRMTGELFVLGRQTEGSAKWRRRQVVIILNDGVLCTFKPNPCEGAESDRIIDLSRVMSVSHGVEQPAGVPADKPVTFGLRLRDGTDVFMRADNAHTCFLWVAVIAEAIGQTSVTEKKCEPLQGAPDEYARIDEVMNKRTPEQRFDWLLEHETVPEPPRAAEVPAVVEATPPAAPSPVPAPAAEPAPIEPLSPVQIDTEPSYDFGPEPKSPRPSRLDLLRAPTVSSVVKMSSPTNATPGSLQTSLRSRGSKGSQESFHGGATRPMSASYRQTNQRNAIDADGSREDSHAYSFAADALRFSEMSSEEVAVLEYAERMKRYSILERALDETERRKADSAMQPQGSITVYEEVEIFCRPLTKVTPLGMGSRRDALRSDSASVVSRSTSRGAERPRLGVSLRLDAKSRVVVDNVTDEHLRRQLQTTRSQVRLGSPSTYSRAHNDIREEVHMRRKMLASGGYEFLRAHSRPHHPGAEINRDAHVDPSDRAFSRGQLRGSKHTEQRPFRIGEHGASHSDIPAVEGMQPAESTLPRPATVHSGLAARQQPTQHGPSVAKHCLQPGDILLSVNRVSLEGKSLPEVGARLLQRTRKKGAWVRVARPVGVMSRAAASKLVEQPEADSEDDTTSQDHAAPATQPMVDTELNEAIGATIVETPVAQGSGMGFSFDVSEESGSVDGPADPAGQPAEAVAPVEAETEEAVAPVEAETAEAVAPVEAETPEAIAPVEAETPEAAAPVETETPEAVAPVEAETPAAAAPVEAETPAAAAPVEAETPAAAAPVEASAAAPATSATAADGDVSDDELVLTTNL